MTLGDARMNDRNACVSDDVTGDKISNKETN